MLAIRLKRVGAKRKPVYRVVVSDSRQRPTGRALEEVGFYDPRTKPAKLEFKMERVDEWLAKGARPSETVKSLLKRCLATPAP